MKQERTKKKVNGLLVFSVGLLAVAVATPLTFALFSDYKQSQTDFTFGKIQIDEGKTTVNTNSANLLPGSAVFTDKVVVAKDLFSESYLLRAKHSFAVDGLTDDNATLYKNALDGKFFAKKDGYGNVKYGESWVDASTNKQLYIKNASDAYELATTTNVTLAEGVEDTPVGGTIFYTDNQGTAFTGTATHAVLAQGLILETQAVDADGKIYTSTYNAITGEYSLTNVDANNDGTQDTVATGYAKNYRWFYNTNDNYFYLCNYFANDGAANATIKNVERTNATATSVTIAEQPFNNLDTKAGRDALVKYFDETYSSDATGSKTLKALKEAVTTAKTALSTNISEYNNAKSATSTAKTNLDAKATTVDTAYNNITNKATNDEAYYTAYKAYRDAVNNYVNNGTNQGAITTAKTTLDGITTDMTEGLSTAVSNYVSQASTTVGNKGTELAKLENKSNLVTALEDAIEAYNTGRDAIAVLLKDYQELYVFALGGDAYNTIPTDLYQATDMAQYNATFTLSLTFEAVQSANVTFENNKTLANATPADIPTGLFA